MPSADVPNAGIFQTPANRRLTTFRFPPMAKKKRNASDSGSASEKPKLDFESALAEVQEVVEQLESGELDLSESLAQYERGIKKIKRCHEVLEQAEKRIAILTEVDADGTATVEPVDYGNEANGGENGASTEKSPAKRAKRRRPPPADSDIDDQDGLF